MICLVWPYVERTFGLLREYQIILVSWGKCPFSWFISFDIGFFIVDSGVIVHECFALNHGGIKADLNVDVEKPPSCLFFVKHCFHLLNCPRVPAKNSAFVNAALADEGKTCVLISGLNRSGADKCVWPVHVN